MPLKIHNIFVLCSACICLVLVLAARHHPPSRRKIKKLWHGRVHWEEDSKTAMLRSSARVTNTTVASTDADTVASSDADTSTDTAPDNIDVDTTVPTMKKLDIELDLELAVIVLTGRDFKDRRNVIRETWGNRHSNVFFIIGKHCPYRPDQRKSWVCEPKDVNVKIDENYNAQQESLTTQLSKEPNVIVVDMIDVYRHLAEKLKLAYMWIVEHTGAKYVLKMDDDSFARVDSVEHWLKSRVNPPKYEIIAAVFSRGGPTRSGKWAETKYKPDKYPPWPSGAGHIVSRPVIEYMHQNAETWVSYQGEDTSLGIWMEKVRPQMDVKRTPSEHFIPHSGDCHNKNKFVIGHSISIPKMRDCYKTLDEYGHVKKAMSPEKVNIDSNDKIDIVIPWAGNPRVKPQIQKKQDPTRDRYNGELPYLLKSIAKNAPWVHKVWVLVDGDPALHELSVPEDLNCQVLDRCSFMPQGSCPTRNGMAVVAFAHRIPKLAEKWIYTADEVFLGRPVEPTHFYKENKPYVWRKRSTWGYFIGKEFHRLYKDSSVVAFKTPKSSSPSPHYWFPQLKSVCRSMEEQYPKFYNFVGSHVKGRYSSLAKGWSDKDNSQEEDFVGWMNWEYLRTGKGIYKNIDKQRDIWWAEVSISKKGFDKAKRDKPIFMNVNDRFSKKNSVYNKQKSLFLATMEEMFPEQEAASERLSGLETEAMCKPNIKFKSSAWYEDYSKQVRTVQPFPPCSNCINAKAYTWDKNDACGRWWHSTPQHSYVNIQKRKWKKSLRIKNTLPKCSFGQSMMPKHNSSGNDCSSGYARLFSALDSLGVVYFPRGGTELGIVRSSAYLTADGDQDIFVDMPQKELKKELNKRGLKAKLSGSGSLQETHLSVHRCPTVHMVYSDWSEVELKHQPNPSKLCRCFMNSIELTCHKEARKRLYTMYGPSWIVPIGIKLMDTPNWASHHLTHRWVKKMKKVLGGMVDSKTQRIEDATVRALLPAVSNFAPTLDMERFGDLVNISSTLLDQLHKNRLQYVAIGGALIGAVRHGGLIPWDDDVELYYEANSTSQNIVLSKVLPTMRRYGFQTWSDDGGWWAVYNADRSVFVSVGPWCSTDDKIIYRRTCEGTNNIIFETKPETLYPLRWAPWHSTMIQIPNSVGEWWTKVGQKSQREGQFDKTHVKTLSWESTLANGVILSSSRHNFKWGQRTREMRPITKIPYLNNYVPQQWRNTLPFPAWQDTNHWNLVLAQINDVADRIGVLK